jgi:hypothetical protein
LGRREYSAYMHIKSLPSVQKKKSLPLYVDQLSYSSTTAPLLLLSLSPFNGVECGTVALVKNAHDRHLVVEADVLSPILSSDDIGTHTRAHGIIIFGLYSSQGP